MRGRSLVFFSMLGCAACTFEPPELDLDGSSGHDAELSRDAASADADADADGGAGRDAIEGAELPPPAPDCGTSICDNPPPIARADTATTAEDTPVSIPVLDNDSDEHGDVFLIAGVRVPAHGVAQVMGTAILYTPARDYFGSDHFQYTIRDTAGATASATVSVTITAVDDPPAVDPEKARTPYHTRVDLVLAGHDAEGEPLTYVVLDLPRHGRLSGAFDGDANLSYTPDVGFAGLDRFTYYANDTVPQASNTATVSIGVLPDDWRLFDWTVRRRLTVGSASIAASLTNFPVLVHLDPGHLDYAKAQPDGRDLRFLGASGAAYSYEIETWTPGGDSYVWVELPSIPSSTTTSLFMYYGNAQAVPAQDAAGTWSSGYLGVWHLDPALISSRTGMAVAANSGSQDAAGQIGRGRSFVSPATLDLGPGLVDTSRGTISVWVKVDVGTDFLDHAFVFYASDQNGGNGFGPVQHEIHLGLDSREHYHFFLTGVAAPTPMETNSPLAYADGRWHHIVSTWDALLGAELFIDGVDVNDGTGVGADFTAGALVRLGGPGAAERYFTGTIDEVRVSGVSRSAAWVLGEYLSSRDRGFVRIGAEDDGIP